MRDLFQPAIDLMNGNVDNGTDGTVRQFRFKVVMYDIVSGNFNIAQIIDGTYTDESLIGSGNAKDVTAYVMDGLVIEDPGDRRAQRLSMSLMDQQGSFNPDGGQYSKYLLEGQVIRVIEGDASLNEAYWICTFTGHVRGQSGFEWDRDSLTYNAYITAYGRRSTPSFLKQKFVSNNYGRNRDYGDICRDICVTNMNLQNSEISRLPEELGKVTQFLANSVVDIAPLEALEKIYETTGNVPEFDADGVLRIYSKDIRRGTDRTYTSLATIFNYRVPNSEIETYNSVSFIGLDKNITEIENPESVVATAVIPVGFWRPTHKVPIIYSHDRKTRVRNAHMLVKVSVSDGLIVDMGSESFRAIDEYSSEIRVSIDDYLATLLIICAICGGVAAAYPDLVVVVSVGFLGSVGSGYTIPVGRIAQGVFITLAMLTLSISSSGSYEILGNTITPVYKELNAIVSLSGTPDYLFNQKEIRNDWVTTEEELKELAMLELIWETAQAHPREVALLNDWALEVGDIIQIPLQGGIRLWVDSIKKTITRGQIPIMEITGYKIPQGL